MSNFWSALGDIASNESAYRNAVIAAVVLLFAASGELIAEKAGTINISLEAMMLGGAFSAAIGVHLAGSTWIGLICAAIAGLVVAAIQANMSHRLPADQFVVGLVLNVLVLGLVGFLTGSIQPKSDVVRRVSIPLVSRIPLLGPALFDQPWVLYLVYPLVPFVWWLVYRTRWGLEIRAVGEDPNAADVSGLDVNKLRRQAIYLTGGRGRDRRWLLPVRPRREVRGLPDRRTRLHRHRRGHLRWLDPEGHGCRLHHLRPRRLVRTDDPVARVQVDRSRLPGDGSQRGHSRGHGGLRKASSPTGRARPTVHPRSEVAPTMRTTV